MDRSSNSVKIEKIRRALEGKNYDAALEIAKTVDSAKIKSAADLSVVAEAYDKKGIYDTALVYYEQIYLKSKTRRILIHLINLCLKLDMADMAESYLRDFTEMAPKDFYRCIFRYHIDKLRGEDLDVLIYDLEQLKSENFMEDWSYELAKLYHKSGQIEKCIAECNDIILWFGSGMYVDRARGLRAIHLSRAAAEGGIAGEVRKLVEEGRSEKELEDFIEEATMPEGNMHYSEEEYNQERFGRPPVYDEEGKDVIWNTREFGAVTEKTIRQQNTMDLLQGMQVADQIRMQTGEGRELKILEPEDGIKRNPVKEAPPLWEMFATPKAQKREAANGKEETAAEKAVRRLQEEKAAREREIEEKLYQMLEQGESEEELSRAIRGLMSSEEAETMVRAVVQKAQETKRFKLAQGGIAGEISAAGPAASWEKEGWQNGIQTKTGAVSKKEDDRVFDRPKQEQEALPEIDFDLLNSDPFLKPLENREESQIQPDPEPELLYEYPEELNADYAQEAPLLDGRLKKNNMKADDFFGPFLASPDLRRQIFSCMEQILQGRSRTINIILTGEERSGKTTLAKAIAKCTQMLGGISSPRVAVIRGDKLNHIDLEAKKDQLKATTMIVERASAMSREKAAQLLSMNEVFAGETAVILEDERRRMNLFLRENEALDRTYTNRVHLPEWSVEDWFVQALWMLYSNEYVMTESVAEKFLYEIRSQIEEHLDDPYIAVTGYTGEVLKRAEKRMAQMLREFAAEGKYKHEELTMLREEDL